MARLSLYDREVAFRTLDSKYCPGCGGRKYGVTCFCDHCLKKLNPGVLKGLKKRESFPWAYYEALKILEKTRV